MSKIRMLKDYRGPLGHFKKGQTYDISDTLIKQLPWHADKNEKWYEVVGEKKEAPAGAKHGKTA